MKNKYLIAVIATMALSACTQLSAEDRALITSAAQSSEEAKKQSIMAVEVAEQARIDAAAARAAAEKAADKSDRIFRQGQNK